MNVFIINIILLFVWRFFSKFVKNKKKFFCIAMCIQITAIIGLRSLYIGGPGIKNDINLYARHFEYLRNVGIVDSLLYNYGKSPIYYFICSLCSKAGISFQLFIFLCTLFSVVVFSNYVYKYSNNCLISYIVYFGVGGFLYSFYLIRQMLAVTILLLAWEMNISKKTNKSLILVVLACLTHYSAIAFVPLLLLSKISISKLIIQLYLFVMALMIAFRAPIARLITLVFAEAYEGHYDSSGGIGGTALVCLLVLLIYIINNYYNITNQIKNTSVETDRNLIDTNQYLLHGLIIMCMIQLCSSYSYAFTRLNYFYFQTVLTLALSQCFSYNSTGLFSGRSKLLVNLLCGSLILILLMYLYFHGINSEMLLDFKFFWE